MATTTTPAPPIDEVDEMVQMIEHLADALPETIFLAALREMVGGSRSAQDAALRRLHRRRGWVLLPESNQKTLTADRRDAAIMVGDQPRHLLARR